jgi:hypothetical protein
VLLEVDPVGLAAARFPSRKATEIGSLWDRSPSAEKACRPDGMGMTALNFFIRMSKGAVPSGAAKYL